MPRAAKLCAGLGTLQRIAPAAVRGALLADQIIDGREFEVARAPIDALTERAERVAERLESLADALEKAALKPKSVGDGYCPVRSHENP